MKTLFWGDFRRWVKDWLSVCIRERCCVGKMSYRAIESLFVPILYTKLIFQLLPLSDGLVCGELQQNWLYLKWSPLIHQSGTIEWYCYGIPLFPLVFKTPNRKITGNKELCRSRVHVENEKSHSALSLVS